MPLHHGKSEKSFKENVRTEMHHGKPLGQSLAIAYAVKRKAQKHKMAMGGYAEGGVCEKHGLDMCKECHAHPGGEDDKMLHQYAGGGDVDTDETDSSKTQRAAGSIRKSFNTPDSAPPPAPKKPAVDPYQHFADVASGNYADGGEVEEKKSGYESMPHENMAKEYAHKLMNQMDGEGDTMKYSGSEEHYPDIEDHSPHDMVSMIMKKHFSKGGQVANDTENGFEADKEPNQFDDLVLEDDLTAHYPGSEEIGDEQEDHDRHDIVKKIMKSRMKKDRMPYPA